jgi:D-glycero-D-manno-heptose 1,7-bisphosphate phosphatase
VKKAVFLDRDGTIIRDRNYLRSANDIEFLSGAPEALKRLKSAGFLLIVCTNQSGIARGILSEREYCAIDRRFRQMLSARGVSLDRTYYCPHLPDGSVGKFAIRCKCRKPGKGMFIAAQKEFGIDFNASFAVGDSLRDLLPAKTLGATTILVKTGKGRKVLSRRTAGQRPLLADHICKDLLAASRKIVALVGKSISSFR